MNKRGWYDEMWNPITGTPIISSDKIKSRIKSHCCRLKTDAQEQAELIKWAKTCVLKKIHPELEMLYAVPNGGKRDRIEAAHLMLQGVKAGVPDLCLAVPKGKYHGLYIELKVGRNKTSEHQDKWLCNLSQNGYAVKVCYGCVSAKQAIERYLKLGEYK